MVGVGRRNPIKRIIERCRQPRLNFWPESGKGISRHLERRFNAILKEIAQDEPEKVRNLSHARWLLDNSHLVRQTLQQVATDFPQNYRRQLPTLVKEDGTKISRVYALVDQAIDQSGLPIDCDYLEQCCSRYKPETDSKSALSESELSLGEVWAIPIMLRTILLDRLCKAAEDCQKRAQDNAETGEEDAEVTLVASCITSLRTVATFNWPNFVESASQLEKVLQKDPSGFYSHMDFETRDHYRQTVEEIAKYTSQTQSQVAEVSLNLAKSAKENNKQRADISGDDNEEDNKKHLEHIGYYLIDKGRHRLETEINYRAPLGEKIKGGLRTIRGGLYLFAILGFAVAASVVIFERLLATNMTIIASACAAALALIPLTSVTSGAVNFLCSLWVKPRPLPKMDFTSGIPAAQQSMVVVPMLLSSAEEITDNLRTLEHNYLGNTDSQLNFALLSDFTDATTEHTPEDQILLDRAISGIDDLNERYGKHGKQPFLLFHRRRLWNDNAGKWMGWERKRGKLEEFNALMRCSEQTSYVVQHGCTGQDFSRLKYVITLDADSYMPTGTAVRLVGIMAHPLNRPRFDKDSNAVSGGYTLIQPRLETNPVSGANSLFARIFAGDVLLDLYTNAVSDVYQDLFGEAIFAGKGIYDLDAFSRSIRDRVPVNAVLSHDLLEGLLGRAGLASDTVLLENYPSNYVIYLKRLHRWIRGDWQLLPWLFAKKGAGSGRFNPGMIGRWKIIDNLRRSLVMPSILILLVLGWIMLPSHIVAWTLVFAFMPGLPILLRITLAFRTSLWRWGTIRSSARNLASHTGADAARWILALVFLPAEAYVAMDAVLRTIYRVSISHHHLLEWSAVAEVSRALGKSSRVKSFWRNLWFGPATAAVVCAAILVLNPDARGAASAFLLLWLFSPFAALWLGRQIKQTPPVTLREPDALLLRGIARDTWRFFERFVGPDTSWLPPDNVQEYPKQIIAERTSPTNIGMMLLSTLTAYDMGYLGQRQLLTRLSSHLDSIQRLRKHRGHIFNWYSTRDLHPLEPLYISTVDSGNLVAALIVMRQALKEMPKHAHPAGITILALSDELAALRRQLFRGKTDQIEDEIKKNLIHILDSAAQVFAYDPDVLSVVHQFEHSFCNAIEQAFLNVVEEHPDWWSAEEIANFRENSQVFRQRIRMVLADIDIFSPWLEKLDSPPTVLLEEDYTSQFQLLMILLSTRSDTSDFEEGLDEVIRVFGNLRSRIEAGRESARALEAVEWLNALEEDIQNAGAQMEDLNLSRKGLIDRLSTLIDNTNFTFLYDQNRHLFRVGYNATTGEDDTSYYDLLASEARIASFVAIANGDVPAKHWMQLGRPLTRIRGLRILLSWSATAFEYLMPRLIMNTPAGALINQSCEGAVKEQVRFGHQHHIPWGISESGYAQFDSQNHYQYNAFGIPRLGLKWDQGERLVVSSYASVLALPYAPEQTLHNLRRLISLGASGDFGLYEALDFGDTHKPRPARPLIVQSYMAHHQGMIMVAIGNALHKDKMLARFHADPKIASIEHLLYEQLPLRMQTRPLERLPSLLKDLPSTRATVSQWQVHSSQQELAVLSNGLLSSRISDQGGSALYWRGLAITRWDPLGAGAVSGSCTYIKDLDSQQVYVLGGAPLPGAVEAIFAPHSVEFRVRNNDLLMRMTILVAPSADVEIRRITITNDGSAIKRVQLFSYSEPVLTEENADRRHPAFSKLFIESGILEHENLLLFRRRPRDSNQPSTYLAHAAVAPEHLEVSRTIETDRGAFIGRGGSLFKPAALNDSSYNLEDQPGATLDPCASIALTLDIPARSTVECAFLSSVADTRAAAIDALKPFQSLGRVDWTMEAARMYSESELTGIHADSDSARESFKLLANIIWPKHVPHLGKDAFYETRRVQDSLWRRGISGDRPIVTMQIDEESDLEVAETLLKSINYLSHKDVYIDVVFLDKTKGGYTFPISDRLRKLVDAQREQNREQCSAPAYIVPVQYMSPIEISDLISAARIFIDPSRRSSRRAFDSADYRQMSMPAFVPQPSAPLFGSAIAEACLPEDLLFKNHLGGMRADLSGYCMLISRTSQTPAPWCNVLANPQFGTLVSESGSMCTWWGNSSENRLTPWSNDPVLDKTGEAIYVRDEETGESWSLTPQPRPDGLSYVVTHAIGESTFEHNSRGLEQRLQVFVDPEEPLKVLRIGFTNKWPRVRRLTVTFAVEWLIGNSFSYDRHLLVPEREEETDALMVRNAFPRHGREELAFIASNLPAHGVSCDGIEFFGKRGSWEAPAGLTAVGLSDRVEASPHPCAVYQVHVELQQNDTFDFHFVLGAAENLRSAKRLINKSTSPDWIEERYQQLARKWDQLLGTWKVNSSDVAMDAMLNKWFLYQVISSRLWGRVGFYQASGGFGFRDQLQDVLALLDTHPEMAKEQIRVVASRQFPEGDVLHWWHDAPLRGVRTRISDDLLWLPYAVAEYIDVTGNFSILEDRVPFLQGESLGEDEAERYAEYLPGNVSAGIYEHCYRAIDARIAFGSHGIPFIGTGDWNDGLNRVGEKGQGESVWMGWFLAIVCRHFAPLCKQVNDAGRAEHYEKVATELLQRTQKIAWAGQWYLRGYFDDGTPLGAPGDEESEIDLNAQTWAVLADPTDSNARQAMKAVEEKLIDSEHQLIKLLAPPFEKSEHDPGYIRSYPRGVRENGGQYTHAAVWAPWAAVELGNAEQAMLWFDWLNPLKRASTREEIDHYRLEPYVTPGDVYGVGELTGRGGWSWYTGSAAWLYRLAVRKLLGLQRKGDKLFIRPCLPEAWSTFEATLRYEDVEYQLRIHDPSSIKQDRLFLLENGSFVNTDCIHLTNQVDISSEGRQADDKLEERSQADGENSKRELQEIEVFASDLARRNWLARHSI